MSATVCWGSTRNRDCILYPGKGTVVLIRPAQTFYERINPSLPVYALDDAYRKLTRPEGSTLEARNREFHRMLVNGVEIEYREVGGRVRGELVRVIDFDVPANNGLLAVNQFTVTENRYTRRPDVVLFVNGLPLGLMELKNPTDEEATVKGGVILGHGVSTSSDYVRVMDQRLCQWLLCQANSYPVR